MVMVQSTSKQLCHAAPPGRKPKLFPSARRAPWTTPRAWGKGPDSGAHQPLLAAAPRPQQPACAHHPDAGRALRSLHLLQPAALASRVIRMCQPSAASDQATKAGPREAPCTNLSHSTDRNAWCRCGRRGRMCWNVLAAWLLTAGARRLAASLQARRRVSHAVHVHVSHPYPPHRRPRLLPQGCDHLPMLPLAAGRSGYVEANHGGARKRPSGPWRPEVPRLAWRRVSTSPF